MTRLLRLTPALALAALALSAVIASAQQRGGRQYRDVPQCNQPDECPRTPYDGRFTFVRVYFDTRGGSLGGFGRGRTREPPWHHDRPYAERNLSAILREVSLVQTFDGPTGGNVFALDDPEIFRYPVLWLSEPGFWVPTDDEVEALRAYLLKGGFMIFDDFGGYGEMSNLVEQLHRALPELEPIRLTGDEPVFKSFFDIELGALTINQSNRASGPTYWGLFEDNDRSKRQLVIMNADNDIGEYMEYSAEGFYPVDMSNDAYKLAVNYMVYALTH
ncbi:MAG TPA: DUF4159 domain-containing protein [Longimicrobiales bacterium]